MTTYQRLVLSGDLPRAEEGIHGTKSSVGASEDNKTGGVHAQSVNHHFIHTTRLGTITIKDGLVQGWVALVFSGDGKDTGWFADDNDVFILEHYIEVLDTGKKQRIKVKAVRFVIQWRRGNRIHQRVTESCSSSAVVDV